MDDDPRRSLADRARAGQAKVRAVHSQATEKVEQLSSERDRRPWVDYMLRMRDLDREIAGRELAAALAYRFFLLLLPLLLVIVGGLGLFDDVTGTSSRGVVHDAGASKAAAETIAQSVGDASLLTRVSILVTGLIGVYFASLGLAKTLYRASANIWSVPTPRVQRKGRVAGTMLLFVVGLLVASAASTRLRDDAGFGALVVVLAVTALLYAALFVLLQRSLPHPRALHWTAFLPGSLAVASAFALLQGITLAYLTHKIASSSELYGGLGVAIVLLGWLYVLGRGLVVAPVANAVRLTRNRPISEVRSPPETPGTVDGAPDRR